MHNAFQHLDRAVADAAAAEPLPAQRLRAQPMRLAIVMSSMSFGGAQRVTALLCNHWVERGEEVCLITLDSGAADCYPLDGRVRRITLDMAVNARNVLDGIEKNRRRVAALRRSLSDFRATVVLSFGDQTNVLAVLATRFTSMRCIVAEVTDPAHHTIGKMWGCLRRLTYPLASGLVVQTRALLPWARSMMLGRPAAYAVRNPVRDMRRFVRSEKRRHNRVIVAAGRLAPEKGFDVLLAAFAQLANTFDDWRLVVLGEGPERRGLTALAEQLGVASRVSFPGWHAEPGQPLSEADLFVMSSRYEGFPNALLEAMACGLPVISTDSLGSREIITHGLDGVLVPVDSVPRLAAAMRELMANEAMRKRLSQSAANVARRCSLDAVVREWDAILSGGGLVNQTLVS